MKNLRKCVDTNRIRIKIFATWRKRGRRVIETFCTLTRDPNGIISKIFAIWKKTNRIWKLCYLKKKRTDKDLKITPLKLDLIVELLKFHQCESEPFPIKPRNSTIPESYQDIQNFPGVLAGNSWIQDYSQEIQDFPGIQTLGYTKEFFSRKIRIDIQFLC